MSTPICVCPTPCPIAPSAFVALWQHPVSFLITFAPLPRPLLSVTLEASPTACCQCLLPPRPHPRPRAHVWLYLPGLAELDLQRALSLQAPPVKEGPLFIHRTKGKSPLLSSSFKKLYFSLTTEALSFAKTPSSKVGKEGGGTVEF